MTTRIGLGPVFAYEWRMASRRWPAYALRSLTVLLLLVALIPVWSEWPDATIARQAQITNIYYLWISMIMLGLVGLAAPAATAGAVCQDKARGNMSLLLTTDLSDTEIVLGKLAARLVPVLGMIFSVAPVLAITTMLGGVDPVGVLGILLDVLACAIFGCSLALTLSVWGEKSHEVLLATYVFGIVYLLAGPISLGFRAIVPVALWSWWLPSIWEILRYNPVFLVLATLESSPPGRPVTIATHAGFLALGLAASSVLIASATWRIRAVTVRQLSRGEGTTSCSMVPGPMARARARLRRLVGRLWPGPSLDRNPVLWHECRRKRPSRLGRVAWGMYVLVCGGLTLYAITGMLAGNRWGRDLGAGVNGFQVGAGLLLVAVSAATSLAEERQRGSLDVLMATPLPTRSIVWGKWRGAFRAVPPLLILPTVLTAALTSNTGRFWGVALMAALILAYGAAVTSLGLALATWDPRMGRAAALTVGLYTFMCTGWVPFCLLVFGDEAGGDGIGLAAGSPLFGVRLYSEMLANAGPQAEFASQTLWVLFWTIADSGVALALLLATLGTFNRCLGRIDVPSILDDDREGTWWGRRSLGGLMVNKRPGVLPAATGAGRD